MNGHGPGTRYVHRNFEVEAASLAERRRRASLPDAVIVERPSSRVVQVVCFDRGGRL